MIEDALRHLRRDKAFAALIRRVGPPRIGIQRGRSPYEALMRAIAHQQLHGRAALAILARFEALYPADSFPAPELIERLTSIRGVGRWTVEMLLIFTLGRPDVLPVDDFGVRDGYRVLYGLDEAPKPKALAEIGQAWSPHRSIAAWYLWRASDEGKRAKQSTSRA
jgi:DNA-3-methyladenine glycosylase II